MAAMGPDGDLLFQSVGAFSPAQALRIARTSITKCNCEEAFGWRKAIAGTYMSFTFRRIMLAVKALLHAQIAVGVDNQIIALDLDGIDLELFQRNLISGGGG